jgi:hypothetical protein
MDTPSPSLPPASQPQQGSNTGKIIVIIVAILAGLCLVLCAVGVFVFRSFGQRVAQGVDTDPQDVSEQSAAIADFDVPAGFEAESSMHFLGFTFVLYQSQSLDSVIVLVQMPIQDQMTDANIRQMQDQMERQYGRSLRNLETIDEYDATIRGEPGKVIIQEGVNENGVTFRQMLVVFQGEGGLAMMSILGPADNWDQNAYDALVESIR